MYESGTGSHLLRSLELDSEAAHAKEAYVTAPTLENERRLLEVLARQAGFKNQRCGLRRIEKGSASPRRDQAIFIPAFDP